MSERSYSLLEFTLTGRQKHLINTTKKKSLKQEKSKIFSFKTKNFRRKISFRGPNVRYKTPLHPRLHPVTPFQSKQF